jgi:hypothetical protein
MKKILVSSLSVVALAILGTGCLKDNDYEDQQFGTQVQDARAISFPLSRSVSSVTYGVLSSLDPVTVQGPFIAMEAPNAQSADVHYTVQIDDALVTADPSLTIMPPAEYSFDLNRSIVTGYMFDSIIINLPHSSNLDPNLTYGIGVRLVSADNGFTVAGNMSSLLLKFTVKNKYDGVYRNTGTFVDHTNPLFADRYPLEYRLVTTGPTSVDVQLLVNGSWDPAYLFFNGTGGSFYGNYGLTMSFDPTNNDIISDLHNYYGDPSKATTAVGTPSAGTGPPDYAASNTRRAVLDPTGVNRWEDPGAGPNTAFITIKHQMLQPSVVPSGPRCEFDELWERTGDRP